MASGGLRFIPDSPPMLRAAPCTSTKHTSSLQRRRVTGVLHRHRRAQFCLSRSGARHRVPVDRRRSSLDARPVGSWHRVRHPFAQVPFCNGGDDARAVGCRQTTQRPRRKTRNFADEATTEPSVIGWMPSAQLYFDDPDGHLLEYITLLDDEPESHVHRPPGGLAAGKVGTQRVGSLSPRPRDGVRAESGAARPSVRTGSSNSNPAPARPHPRFLRLDRTAATCCATPPCNCGASSSATRQFFTNFTSLHRRPLRLADERLCTKTTRLHKKSGGCTKTATLAAIAAAFWLKSRSFPNRARSSAIVTLAAGS